MRRVARCSLCILAALATPAAVAVAREPPSAIAAQTLTGDWFGRGTAMREAGRTCASSASP
jgi:hypothetical protein